MSEQSRTTTWYFQADGVAHGPASMEQIVQLLVEGQLQFASRISTDQQNWKAICNEDSVEVAIREVIVNISKSTLEQAEQIKEASITQSEYQEKTGKFDLQKLSNGISEQLKDAHELSVSNYTVNSLRQVLSSLEINRKKIINLDQKVEAPKLLAEDADVYIQPIKANKKDNREKYRSFAIALGTSLVLGVSFFAYHQYAQYKAAEQQKKEKDLAEKTLQERILSFSDRVIKLPAAERTITNPKALVTAAQAMLNSNDVSLVKEVSARILGQVQDKAIRSQAYMLNGQAFMLKKDWKAAGHEFEAAILEDPSIAQAHYYLGLSYLNRELYEDASKTLSSALELGANRTPTIFAIYEAAAKLESKLLDSKYEKLILADQLLLEHSQTHPDLKAESLIARIHIANITKNSAQADLLSHEFINLNPEGIQKEKLRSNAELERISWNHVYTWCTDSYSLSQNSGVGDAVLAGCLLQIQKNSDAVTFAKAGFQKLPNDKLVKAILGYSMQSMNLNEDTKNLFGNDDEKTMPRLSLLSLAHICEKEKTSDCALKYWTQLAQQDKTDPSAFVGLMNFYIDKDDLTAAKKTAEEGISRQPASEDLEKVSKRLKAKGLNLW